MPDLNSESHYLAQEALHRTMGDLEEQVRVLNCLYTISQLIETKDSREEVLQGSIDLILHSCRAPELAGVRILLDGQVYEAGNFMETKWQHSQELLVRGRKVGSVAVGSLTEKTAGDEGVFCKEECAFVKTVAEMIGRFIERQQTEEEREDLIAELLQRTMTDIKALSGLIPICSYCKQVRSGEGGWHLIEVFLEKHTDAEFSHGICPDCYARRI